MDEAALVRQARSGDRQAFAELFRRHVRDAVRTAYCVVRDWETAEDAVQEAFIRAYAGMAAFDPARPFRPWLYRIVVREALRAAGRRERVTPIPEVPESAGPDVESEALAGLERRRLREAVLRLDAKHRLVVVLKYFLEFREQEIAQILGVPVSTVKSRLFEARRRLEQTMAPDVREAEAWIPGTVP